MPQRAIESIAWQLGQQELSIRAITPASPILFCSYRCNNFLLFSKRNLGFSRELPTSLCYIYRHKLKVYNLIVLNMQQSSVISAVTIQVNFNTVAQQANPPPQILLEPASSLKNGRQSRGRGLASSSEQYIIDLNSMWEWLKIYICQPRHIYSQWL